jgi:hypothetical protein
MSVTRRALAYVRRSSSASDFDPHRQLECIINEAASLGVRLDANLDDMEFMQRSGLQRFRGIVLDGGSPAEL